MLYTGFFYRTNLVVNGKNSLYWETRDRNTSGRQVQVVQYTRVNIRYDHKSKSSMRRDVFRCYTMSLTFKKKFTERGCIFLFIMKPIQRTVKQLPTVCVDRPSVNQNFPVELQFKKARWSWPFLDCIYLLFKKRSL